MLFASVPAYAALLLTLGETSAATLGVAVLAIGLVAAVRRRGESHHTGRALQAADHSVALMAAPLGIGVLHDAECREPSLNPALASLLGVRAGPGHGLAGPTAAAGLHISATDRVERELRRSEERFRSLVSATSQIVWTADASGGMVDGPPWREITGQAPDAVRGAGWVNAIHPSDRVRTLRRWHAAVARRTAYEAECRLCMADGTFRWFTIRAVPVLESNGAVREWVGTATDVHQRRAAEDADALLLEAARVLSSSLELEETLQQVVQLVVPQLADYALLYLKAADGGYHQMASAHVDPEKEPLLVELGQVYRPDLRNPNSPLARVLSTMQPVFARAASPEHARALLQPDGLGIRPTALRIYQELDPVSYIIVPLVAHGDLLGSLVLVSSVSRRHYSTEDLALAELTGARAALAIENARLYREAHEARDRAVRAAQLESQLVRARLEALRAQLDPHFLFNSLNTIAMLVRRDAKRNALQAVVSLSELLRRVLASREALEVPLDEELALIERYLELERMRFRDRLHAHVDAPSDTRDAMVPSLILQPLVENAVKHGVARADGNGRITVTARRENGRLLLRVQDNGPGFPSTWDATAASGVGLANTRERLGRMYGSGGYRLRLGNAPGGGAFAAIDIPFRGGDDPGGAHGDASDRGGR